MLEKIIPKRYHKTIYKLKQSLFGSYYQKSYSQEGEDLIINRMLENVKNGFFVDVGAHHPKRFSNTYFFYQRGWRGINIDAMPGSMKPFQSQRNNDINLEIAISDQQTELSFYIFEEPAINSFDEALSEQRIKNGNKLIKKQNIKTQTLAQVLQNHLPQSKQIDFMSIDVEGFDLKILKSNDWQKYKPNVIVIECLENDIIEIQNDPMYNYLIGLNYTLAAKTANTCFFKLK